MIGATRVAIPTLVRIKPAALERVGVYLARFHHQQVIVFQSCGLVADLTHQLRASLQANSVHAAAWIEVAENDFEHAIEYFSQLPKTTTAIVGCGGGKALVLCSN